MKADTQHLDFLISQYVDGTLDAPSKKSVEQQLVNDPGARKLYTEHREMQDLLDDWGDRIPLVNWDDFDKKLSDRLEKEQVGSERKFWIYRWMRPVAAAAALFIAASIGYSWHAWWGNKPGSGVAGNDVAMALPSHTVVNVVEGSQPAGASRISVRVMEEEAFAGSGQTIEPKALVVSVPENAAAVESLKDSLAYGMRSVTQAAQPARGASSTVAVDLVDPQRTNPDGLPVYP